MLWPETSIASATRRGVPRMGRVKRSAIRIAADDIASRFLPLDERIVMILADALMVVGVNEQRPVAFVRRAVIDHGGGGDPARLLASLA